MRFITTLLATIFLTSANAQTIGLQHYDPELSYEGMTLIDPISTENIYLIDNCGKLVHTWTSDYNPRLTSYLLEDGTLLRATRGGEGNIAFNLPNGGGLVEKLDWNSNVLWSYTFSNDSLLQHHDIEPMPNGNILVLVWDRMTNEEAIQAGRNPSLLPDGELWPDAILEVEPVGSDTINIVWFWRFKDHLIQDFDASKDNYGVVADHPELLDINYVNNNGANDWIHGNSIAYNETRDEIVISSRKMSEIYIIDHSTTMAEAAGHSGGNRGKGGDFLYRWGNPQVYDKGTEQDRALFGQHDAHWIPEGYPDENKIILFNNGRNRTPIEYTTIDIIEPPLALDDSYTYLGAAYGPVAASWSYEELGEDTLYGSFISGAHQLPNGNVLIADGPSGVIQEVTANGELAWEYVVPVDSDGPISQGETTVENTIFRTRRYAMDYPGLPNDLIAGEPIELNPTPSNCEVVYLSIQNSEQPEFSIYPNPATQSIAFNGASGIETVRFFDAKGVLVQEQIVDLNETLDISSLSSGIYFVNIELTDANFWSKLVVTN
ncbi:MAG: aryl-sulfate sulfotransferase [Flavobacteriales bacterium]|nr:aryl-sulfate sulfotransferase [Flavobacteriales bacterium]